MNAQRLMARMAVALMAASLAVLAISTSAPAAGRPKATLSVTGVSFGYQGPSQSEPHNVLLTNTGSTTLVLGRVAISGADSTEFAIRDDSCSYQSIAAGSFCRVNSLFAPIRYPYGSRQATLTFPTNTGTLFVPLSGTSTFAPPIRTTTLGGKAISVPVDVVSRGPGTDPNIWFNRTLGGELGRLSPSGVVSYYKVGDGANPVSGITPGPPSEPSNLYLAAACVDCGGDQLFRAHLDSSGAPTFTQIASPTSGSVPTSMAVGPDGNIWGIESFRPAIFRYTLPSGPFEEFTAGLPPCCNAGLAGITAGVGSDPNLYFTMSGTNQLGRISTGAHPTITILATVLPAQSGPDGIVLGPDGNIWVTLYDANSVAQVATSGKLLALHQGPTDASGPANLAFDRAGHLWVTESGEAKLGHIGFASGKFAAWTDSSIVDPFPLARFVRTSGLAISGAGNVFFGAEFQTDQPSFGDANLLGEFQVTGQPAGATSPSSVDFGSVQVGSFSGNRTIQVQNTGTNDLHVTGVTGAGPGVTDFYMQANGCSGAAITPSSTCSLSVVFQANALGKLTATLTVIVTNQFGVAEPSLMVALTGTGTP